MSEGTTPHPTMSRSASITRGSHLQGDSAVELLAENLPYVISPWATPSAAPMARPLMCGPVVMQQG